MTTYDPGRPWQDQIDRDAVGVLLREWLPEALERFGFEAIWTPKRLIEHFADGHLDRESVIQVLARYPYLRIPPTPEVETFADVPDEGSVEDLMYASFLRQIDGQFFDDVRCLGDQFQSVGDKDES